MSTQIFNTAKIPTTKTKSLIKISRQIQAIEFPALWKTLEVKYALSFSDETKSILHLLYHEKEGDVSERWTKKKLISQAITRFIGLTKMNPTISTNQRDKDIFCEDLKAVLPELSLDDLELFVDLVEEVACCRTLSFLSTGKDFTLLKWYHLTDASEKWIYANYEEFDYQDSCDGPELKELDPGLHNSIEEVISDFLGYEFKEASVAEVDLVTKVKDIISRQLSYDLYKRRGKMWDDAIGGHFVYNQASLSFDMFSGHEYSEKITCERIVIGACRPQEEFDQDILRDAIEAKRKDDEWRESLRKKFE